MSQKSNSRKSQKGGVSYHDMKRGLNNWNRHTSFDASFKKTQNRSTGNNLSSVSISVSGGANAEVIPNSPVPHTMEDLPKKPCRPLVM